MRFVDTNVLLYAVSTVRAERAKNRRALEILEQDDLALSVQVLQEFYVQATRPTKRRRLSHDHAVALIESWLRYRVEENSVELMRNALATRVRWKVSYWDAAIVESARQSGSEVLLTEDLQHGFNFAGVRVENPFS